MSKLLKIHVYNIYIIYSYNHVLHKNELIDDKTVENYSKL